MNTTKRTNQPDFAALALQLKAMREATTASVNPFAHERRRTHHMGARSLLFLLETVEVMRDHDELLPPAFERDEFERRVTQIAALHDFISELKLLNAEAQAAFLTLTKRLLPDGRFVRDYAKTGVRSRPHVARRMKKMRSRAKPRGSEPLASEIFAQKVTLQRKQTERTLREAPRTASNGQI